jgi:RHS repeat-associated protein
MQNRVYKASSVTGNRKYIVDIVACPESNRGRELPTILLEINPSGGSIMKTYVYANSQILAQHNGNYNAPRFFYLHDRLGSVRLVINSAGDVNDTCTYNPFGEMFAAECNEDTENNFKFIDQCYDSEIGQYYLRARMYDPQLMRLTSRDPLFGKFEQPMSLHKYLYCGNNPINFIDPQGLWTRHVMLSGMLSFGPSLMYQKGFVIDDEGNIGVITTSNAPHPIEGVGDWGLGLGVPSASAGVAFGWTNADTIFDLRGPGITIGGSVGVGFGIGVDYLQGIQRNGQYYYGAEFVPQYGVSSAGIWEVHGQATWTTVVPLGSNQQEGLDIVQGAVENAIFDVQTVGQGEVLLTVWGML